MNILICGANGFIGAYLTAHLLRLGFDITACVRDPNRFHMQFPDCKAIHGDFNTDIQPEDWLPRLQNIDVVINAVGILQASRQQNIDNIHYQTPKALFQAAQQSQVNKIIHISALGIENSDSLYAQSKLRLEKFLASISMSHCIIRPSLVYAAGSYGGTSLIRALAALPFFTPVVGAGQQKFSPIHVEDLCELVSKLVIKPNIDQHIINAVGPQTLSLTELLIKYRQWLGYKPTKLIHIPQKITNICARVGDLFTSGAVKTTTVHMLNQGSHASTKSIEDIDIKPRSFSLGLQTTPCQVQDRWHARLYFLKPCLQIAIGLLWIISGLVPLFLNPSQSINLLQQIGIPDNFLFFSLYSLSILDIILGIAVLSGRFLSIIAGIQCLIIISYTLTASLTLSYLWIDPLAPLLKNIPILIGILMLAAMDRQR